MSCWKDTHHECFFGICACMANCFPADATVEVASRGRVPMAQLNYGDRALARDRASGELVHREVYLFGHRDAGTVNPNYVSLKTAAGPTLQLSASHYIPVCASACDSAQPAMEAKYASEVRVGDLVLVMAAGGQATQLSAVVEAWQSAAVGAFNPYVRGADLVVDGVVSSARAPLTCPACYSLQAAAAVAYLKQRHVSPCLHAQRATT
jgi:hypothetical protein